MGKNEIKITKKIVYEVTKNDKKLLELIQIAGEIILREDAHLLKELAKH